jgi:predicted nucleic acid-binding Zn ribbon protein
VKAWRAEENENSLSDEAFKKEKERQRNTALLMLERK